jgi:hypothetical protein
MHPTTAPLIRCTKTAHGPIGSKQTKNFWGSTTPPTDLDRGRIVIAIIGAGFDDSDDNDADEQSLTNRPRHVAPLPSLTSTAGPLHPRLPGSIPVRQRVLSLRHLYRHHTTREKSRKMSPAGNMFRASRPAFRSANQFFSSSFRRPAGRRFQSTSSDSTAQEPWLKRMWNSPIGLKTVHFWYASPRAGSPRSPNPTAQIDMLTLSQGSRHEMGSRPRRHLGLCPPR